MTQQHNIPGVYSEIDASAAVKSLSSNEIIIGIVAVGTSDDTVLQLTNKAYAPVSFDDAKTKFGPDSNIVQIMKTSIANGGNKFIVVRADDKTTPGTVDYQSALDILALEEAVDIVLIDSTDTIIFSQVKTHCETASLNRKERIALVGFASGTEIPTITTAVASLNSGRIYTFYPNVLDVNGIELTGFYGAAALAGLIAAESDPSMPMTNVELISFYGLAKKLKDDEMETLIGAGVIPLEVRNGVIRIVRFISTYTKDANGNADITWQELTTTRISDYIFKDLRTRLARKFSRSKQGKNTRDAIKSEVLTSLILYQTLEYIENVTNGDVTININPTNPLRNDVNFNYDVTGPLNVINLKGHLSV